MNAFQESDYNSNGLSAERPPSCLRLTLATAVLVALAPLGVLMPGAASAQVAPTGGQLSLCPNGSLGASGRIWAHTGTSSASACGGYYSFALGNGSGGVESNGSSRSNSLVQGYGDGRLLLRGEAGVRLEGVTTFNAAANLGNNKVTNLANGTAPTDAVNVRQLTSAVADATGSDYIQVGAGQTSTAASNAGRAGNIAIGGNARSNSPSLNSASIALGEDSLSNNAGSVAIGTTSTANASGAVAIGLRAKAEANNAVALGADSVADRADSVSVGSTARRRQITNLAAGTTDNDAVNLGQMNSALANYTSNRLVKVNGATDAQAAGGNAIAIGNGTSSSGISATAVGANASASGAASAALGDFANSAGVHAVAIGHVAQASQAGAVAIGDQARATHDNSVALGALSTSDRANSVSVGSATLQRQITQMAAGTQDNDAVNLAQLKGNARATASALGGGAAPLPDGSLSAPTYRFGSSSFNNVGDALSNLDGRVGDLEVGDGLVSYNDALGRVEVARAKGGDQVDISGSAGRRRVAGLANGLNDDEAVTVAQLKAAGVLDPASGSILSALTYDDTSLATATLGGTRGTVIDNLADGQVTAASVQAINGRQLYQALSDAAGLLGGGASVGLQGAFVAPTYTIQNRTYRDVGSALEALDGKVSDLDQRTLASASGGPRTGTFGTQPDAGRVEGAAAPGASAPTPAAAGATAQAPAVSTSAAATAVGEGALASGVGSAAIGDHAVASADGSVALGSGSVADRVNSVSVGSAGSERQITNVGEGTEDTDAVNKGQLDRGVATANRYTDSKMSSINDSFDVFKGEVDGRLRNMDRRIDRQGAMSAAMLNMATSAAGVRTDNRVGVGVGFQGGESALSLGYQRAISERATVTLGGAFSGDDASVGFGAGFGW